MDLDNIARTLRRRHVIAHPCPWLQAVSVFVDEQYDNFDYDIIGPRARLKIAAALKELGFDQKSGRRFEKGDDVVEFPPPTRTLASDPGIEFERTMQRAPGAVLATPTQILLTTWRHEGPVLAEHRRNALLDLVFEQPANLDKVHDWLRRTDSALDFRRFKPALAARQAEGTQRRRQGRMRSAG
jgi:hypothetical protein